MSAQAKTGLTRARAEEFLYREAQLCDEHRFDEWMKLWGDSEITYWIPANHDDIDPKRHVSIAYEDRKSLEERIIRLKARGMHSQRPQSRMRRLISNIVIESDDGAGAQIEANFILLELRAGVQSSYGGRMIFRVCYDDAGIRMESKKILLINNDECLGNLTFLM